MGVLSRIALAIFILFIAGFWTQVAVEKFENAWILAAAAMLSAMTFAILGLQEDNA